jgi:hypothetical protein
MAAVQYFTHNNQPKTRGRDGEGMRYDARAYKDVRGARFHCAGLVMHAKM